MLLNVENVWHVSCRRMFAIVLLSELKKKFDSFWNVRSEI